MEEPEQEREDGTESPKNRGAWGAVPQRLASRMASPRGPRQREERRFTGALQRLLPPPPLCPPARPRPPPPAAAATASPSPPRPPGPWLRAASDQRPPRTRLSTANRRPAQRTSHSTELGGRRRVTHVPLGSRSTSLSVGHAPSADKAPKRHNRRPTCAGPTHLLALEQEVLKPSAFRLSMARPVSPARAASAHGSLGLVVLLPAV